MGRHVDRRRLAAAKLTGALFRLLALEAGYPGYIDEAKQAVAERECLM